MILRLHGQALVKESRSTPQIDKRVVHLLAARYIRSAITDFYGLVNSITAALPTLCLRVTARSLCFHSKVREYNDRQEKLHSKPGWNHDLPLHLKKTLLELDP